ncbi:MAG: tetratricopeptide repeat protein [Spirochaetales bacterium]|nr:MAG: tetratricopeptide repeat protein [Spirochaetales bacterium]
MVIPENRYRSTYRKFAKKSGKGKIILLVLFILAAGVAAFFLFRGTRFRKTVQESDPLTLISEYWKSQKYAEIITSCDAYLKNKPMDAYILAVNGFAHFYEGIAQYSLEDRFHYFDRAVVLLRKAELVASRPFSGEIKYILGKTYYHKGKYYKDEAVRFLEASIAENYRGEDSYEYLALAYSEMEMPDKSLEYFLKAADSNPSDLLLLTIGQNYYKLSRYNDAEEYLLRTINRTKDTAIEEKSRFLLGKIYFEKKELLKAEDQYNKILEKNQDSADAHYLLGEIYQTMNDTIKARAEWRKTLQIDPSHYGARLNYYK